MSRITGWKLEKTKVKVVFRLQFHATHIPQSGWDKLFISFIPADSGKATAKTTKANVRNGTCKWADPIYETARLLQDLKTKQYDEKLYKLVVAMGTSRASILGEAIINLADYADALKPSVIALPLHGCDSGTILHVTVQLLTSKTGFREFEQQRELRERGLQTDSGELVSDRINKVNSRVRFVEKSKDLASLEEETGPNEEYADSAAGFDGSSNTSESLYAEKHETSSVHEIDSLRGIVSGDLAGLSISQSPQPGKVDPSDQRFSAQGTNDWVHGWSSDCSMDNDLAAAYEENGRLRGSLEAAESSIHELKMEVSLLQSHANEIGHQAQEFAKQLAAEIVSGKVLVKEVSALKSECSELKDDIEQLKVPKVWPPISSRDGVGGDQNQVLQNIMLEWLKGLLAIEDKIRELQNKACFGYNERDFGFLHSEIETLLGILQNLKQGSGLPVSSLNFIPPEGATLKEVGEINSRINGQFAVGTGFGVDIYQPELGMLHCLNIPGLISHESDAVDTTNVMKGKIFELLRELDESKTERESLAKKMDQMECYYEALVQELEENQQQILLELQNLRNEHSTCLYTVSSTKAEMESMHQDLNDQILRLTKEKHDMNSFNRELERRAVTAEAALKRARLNYSIAVDQLQKDLELLSFQVLSMHETNENLIRQAFVDSQPSNYRFDSGEYGSKLLQFQNQSVGMRKQQLCGDIHLDDLKRSLHFQEDLYRKAEEEVHEMHFVYIYLDVLSKVLQESLLCASEDVKVMKEKVNELEQQLEISDQSKELLMQELQTVTYENHSLNEHNATCIAEYNDMALQIQNLEAKLQNMSHENHLLLHKITEWESLVIQYRGYEACAAENIELTRLLEKKTIEIGILQNENFSLEDELKAMKTQLDELAVGKQNLENFVNFLQHKLQNVLSSNDRSNSVVPSMSEPDRQGLQSRDLAVLLQLEELQDNSCKKILQLVEENKSLMLERNAVKVSIVAAESQIALMKEKLEHEIQNIVDKLDASIMSLQKLELDNEALANKIKLSPEFEEKYELQHSELLSDLDHLEAQLQELTSQNRDLAHDISALETVTAELTKENKFLMVSLQVKKEESVKLASELNTLKETLQALRDENQALMACSRDKTEESAHLAEELNSLKESLQSLHDENQALVVASQDKAAEAAELALELNSLKGNLQSLNHENQILREASHKAEESVKLAAEIESLKESLQSMHNENKALIALSQDKMEESVKLASELNLLKESLQDLQVEKGALVAQLQDRNEESAQLALELSSLKDSFMTLHDEKQALAASLQEKMDEFANLELELNHLKASLQSLQDEKKALIASAVGKTDEASKLASELHSLKQSLQTVHEEKLVLMACSQERSDETKKLQSELNSLRDSLQSLHNENQALVVSSRDKSDESAQLALELNSLRESLQSLHNQLYGERSLRESLECKMTDYVSQLNEKESQLLHLKKSVSDLESEKLRVCELLTDYERSLKVAQQKYFSISGLETELCELFELLIATDVRLFFTKTQHEGMAEQLLCNLAKLQKQHTDMETTLNCCLASEAHYIEENAKLLTSLNSIRSELEASIAENRLLLGANSIATAELDEYRDRDLSVGLHHCVDKSQHSLELEKLKLMLVNSEEEIDNLVLSKEELEVKFLVLKAQLDEQKAQIIAIEGYHDELKKQYNETTQRLAEQTLKTEEFKNLSIHLKELKDKADAEYTQSHGKNKTEASPVAMQESLRIAFIKEQYETKIQELKHQLSISKKHSEEMLWKLQDAIDEVESRKKCEACHLKKNEELGMKIMELEAELQSVLSDKRERTKAYDLMKAEMECSSISLECCKEEKQKLEASLHECNEEKSKIVAELVQTKELLENSKSAVNNEEVIDASGTDDPVSYGQKSADVVSSSCGNIDASLKCLEKDSSRNCEVSGHTCSAPINEVDQTSILVNVQPEQDVLVFTGGNGTESPVPLDQMKLLHGDKKYLPLINDHFKAKSLMTSLDNLSDELEKMKNENSLLKDDCFDQKFPTLQREFLQLQKANEELGSMFPLFNEFSGSGNALERVLALELELAEALQAKKRSSIHFQSSFLKQHTDEEAVFKSFRDINELIKDMLELKGRCTTVETELKEMHDRYSQLSLQFAEVEGERQKLMMTLKNVRASKKA